MLVEEIPAVGAPSMGIGAVALELELAEAEERWRLMGSVAAEVAEGSGEVAALELAASCP
jgi:hypothetical protein